MVDSKVLIEPRVVSPTDGTTLSLKGQESPILTLRYPVLLHEMPLSRRLSLHLEGLRRRLQPQGRLTVLQRRGRYYGESPR